MLLASCVTTPNLQQWVPLFVWCLSQGVPRPVWTRRQVRSGRIRRRQLVFQSGARVAAWVARLFISAASSAIRRAGPSSSRHNIAPNLIHTRSRGDSSNVCTDWKQQWCGDYGSFLLFQPRQYNTQWLSKHDGMRWVQKKKQNKKNKKTKTKQKKTTKQNKTKQNKKTKQRRTKKTKNIMLKEAEPVSALLVGPMSQIYSWICDPQCSWVCPWTPPPPGNTISG